MLKQRKRALWELLRTALVDHMAQSTVTFQKLITCYSHGVVCKLNIFRDYNNNNLGNTNKFPYTNIVAVSEFLL